MIRDMLISYYHWPWRRLLRVPWTARRSNHSILKNTNPELAGLMLKLKFQYFGQLMQRTDLLEKTLMLGKIEGRRRRGWQDETVGWHHWMWVCANWETVVKGKPGVLQFTGSQKVGHNWATATTDMAVPQFVRNFFVTALRSLKHSSPLHGTRLLLENQGTWL